MHLIISRTEQALNIQGALWSTEILEVTVERGESKDKHHQPVNSSSNFTSIICLLNTYAQSLGCYL